MRINLRDYSVTDQLTKSHTVCQHSMTGQYFGDYFELHILGNNEFID